MKQDPLAHGTHPGIATRPTTIDRFIVDDVNQRVNNREDLQIAGRCTRAYCPLESNGESDYCDEHHEDQKRRQRECMARRRERWEAEKKCTRCGGVRYHGRVWCFTCLRSFDRVPPVANVNNDVNKQGHRLDLEQSPDGKPRLRRRYHGRGSRGRPSAESLDATDIKQARRDVDHGIEGLAYFRSDAVQAMPRIQRLDVRDAAVARIVSAARWLVEVARRNGWDGKIGDSDDDEET